MRAATNHGPTQNAASERMKFHPSLDDSANSCVQMLCFASGGDYLRPVWMPIKVKGYLNRYIIKFYRI